MESVPLVRRDHRGSERLPRRLGGSCEHDVSDAIRTSAIDKSKRIAGLFGYGFFCPLDGIEFGLQVIPLSLEFLRYTVHQIHHTLQAVRYLGGANFTPLQSVANKPTNSRGEYHRYCTDQDVVDGFHRGKSSTYLRPCNGR